MKTNYVITMRNEFDQTAIVKVFTLYGIVAAIELATAEIEKSNAMPVEARKYPYLFNYAVVKAEYKVEY